MKTCIVIPNYNHTNQIHTLLNRLSEFNLPIIMVNDASSIQHAKILHKLPSLFSQLTLIEHTSNKGKGGAVKTALITAHKQGFSHALQVDADGQHELKDAVKLLNLAKQYPQDLISGQPIYDKSIPKLRYFARNITHFWVWVETLSMQIKDTMCGFRVYPLESTLALLKQDKITGNRMDFDIEIMVKLYWHKVNVRFTPTSVIYPEDGISHFKGLQDNLLISWLHTRLCFGMMLRLPQLLHRKFST